MLDCLREFEEKREQAEEFFRSAGVVPVSPVPVSTHLS